MSRADEATPRPLRRRQFLRLSVQAVAGYAVVKGGVRWIVGPTDPASGARRPLDHLSTRQAATFDAAAIAILGPTAEAAYDQGLWQPAVGADRLLAGMAPDQRRRIGVGLLLFEEWSWGLVGFSGRPRMEQAAILADWRTSGMGLKRSIWGFLHAAASVGYGGDGAGWRAMGYPGPCRSGGGHAGRPPGQSVGFRWDPRVP